MYDVSDEATGLPPLSEVDPESAIFVLSWRLGAEGIVTAEDQTVPVRYLSLRGIVTGDDGETVFGQIHVALPHQAVRPMLEQWLETLDATPDTPEVPPSV